MCSNTKKVVWLLNLMFFHIYDCRSCFTVLLYYVEKIKKIVMIFENKKTSYIYNCVFFLTVFNLKFFR